MTKLNTTERDTEPGVLVVDVNQLRRASVESFLGDWARSANMRLEGATHQTVMIQMGHGTAHRLVIVSVGGNTIRMGENSTLLRVIVALAPTTPVVIVSDLEDPQEILAGFSARCKAFIPTSMDPQLALQVLTFVLQGGSFYPPSALRLLARKGDDAPDEGGGIPHQVNQLKQIMPTKQRDGDIETAPKLPRRQACGYTEGLEVAEASDAANPVFASVSSSGAPITTAEPQYDEPVDAIVHDGDEEGAPDSLTSRQQQVLTHLSKGLPNKIIARELGLTEGTVKVHVRQIMRKMGASNRTQAAVLCLHVHNRGVDVDGQTAAATIARVSVSSSTANHSLQSVLRRTAS